MNPEILIIGGGVIGLSIARELHKSGVKRITVLEKGRCGEESSWAAAGMLGPQAEANEGGAFFDMTVTSREMYPKFATDLLAETGVDIELDRQGTLYLAFTDEDVAEVHKRLKWQLKAGLPVEHLSADDARRAEPFISTDVRGALLFPDDWQVENRKLLAALKSYAELNGIEIREDSPVEQLIVEDNRVIGARTATDTFFASDAILATGAWTSLIKLGDADMPLKVEPVRGQIVAFQTAKRLFGHVIYSRRGYIVPRADGRILAGSTSENKGFEKAETDVAASALRQMAAEIAPNLSSLAITDHWSGLRPFAMNGLPVLGSFAGIGNLTIATAHYRNGILLAPLTAKIVADKLLKSVEPPFLAAFSPDRFRLRSVGKVS
ncbi:MAG: glycine oxidase ThiO [Chloracidobacterium sp.]|nr:glycine oxidase ThiO [Chloracidobacterium sp.]